MSNQGDRDVIGVLFDSSAVINRDINLSASARVKGLYDVEVRPAVTIPKGTRLIDLFPNGLFIEYDPETQTITGLRESDYKLGPY